MQRISFAPVLSATRSRDSCWITSNSQDLSGDSRAGSVNRLSGTRVRTHRRRAPPVRPKHGYRDTARTRGARQSSSVLVRAAAPGGRLLLRLLEDLDEPPPLGGRRRPGLHDLDAVTDAGDVLLVVGLQLARAPDDLAVEAVLHAVLDLDDDGLLHLVAHHEALTDLAVATAGQAGARGRRRVELSA